MAAYYEVFSAICKDLHDIGTDLNNKYFILLVLKAVQRVI